MPAEDCTCVVVTGRSQDVDSEDKGDEAVRIHKLPRCLSLYPYLCMFVYVCMCMCGQ